MLKVNIMGNIINWFKESDRWKHLVGGIVIGAGANSIYCAAYAGIGVASALELKDRSWYGKWDWIDWTVTLVGVAIGHAARIGIIALI